VGSDLTIQFEDSFGNLVDPEQEKYDMMKRIQQLERENLDKDKLIVKLSEEIKVLQNIISQNQVQNPGLESGAEQGSRRSALIEVDSQGEQGLQIPYSEGAAQVVDFDPVVEAEEESSSSNTNEINISQFEDLDDDSSSDYLQLEAIKYINYKDDLSEMGEIAGEGNFGVVREAKLKGQHVAVKVLNSAEMYLNDQCRELELSMKLRHKNIMTAVFFYLTTNELEEAQVNIVFPFMDKYDLRHEFEVRQRKISHAQSNKICYEVCKALIYLHQKNIVHRDLKPDNIFLTSQNEIKLGDFGFCAQFSPKKIKTVKVLGSLPYMAPEICKEGGRHTWDLDIWALGVMFCELVSKLDYAPYCYDESLPDPEVMQIIRDFKYPKSPLKMQATSSLLSYELTDQQHKIVRKCLSKKKRPSAHVLSELFKALPHELLF
jgi:hypothetical protein